ncbi:hypothetical protein P154DRAFT_290730 [Amniculicola lignicola CBS 123094]|uniref:Uncharacterized protein n=1 Tax=Amniculicola lignicola CBS 123094 TaxID=1392246 RepID=A0A6A5WW00_9PLEO|nr:hypothetical protein P154DRAFT_290730 [Amniculicola lignicola CBS 123094]
MHIREKELGGETSSRENHGDGDRSSISSNATDSASNAEDILSLHQSLSRNAGLEEPDKGLAQVITSATNMTTDPQFEIDFEDNGDNPRDWSMAKKAMIMGFMSFSTLVVVSYSTSFTSGL